MNKQVILIGVVSILFGAIVISAQEESMKITKDGDVTELVHGQDYIVILKAEGTPAKIMADELIFMGHGINKPDEGWDDYARVNAEGKVLLIAGGAPYRDGKPAFTAELHKQHTDSEYALDHVLLTAINVKAKAILIVVDESMLPAWDRLSKNEAFPTDVATAGGKQHTDIPVMIFVKPDKLKHLIGATGFDLDKRMGDYRAGAFKDTEIEIVLN
jgi:hypothetical protein